MQLQMRISEININSLDLTSEILKSELKGFVPPFLTPIKIYLAPAGPVKWTWPRALYALSADAKIIGRRSRPFQLRHPGKRPGRFFWPAGNEFCQCMWNAEAMREMQNIGCTHTHAPPARLLFGARAATLVCVCSERAERVYRHKGPQVASNTSLARSRTHAPHSTYLSLFTLDNLRGI